MKDERKEASSETLALMELNQQLRISADESLRSIVQQEEQPYALYEGGVWATIIERGDIERGAPKLGEECTVHMRVRSLEGMLYSDEETTATVGKYVWPTAVDRNITEWNHGAKIQLYAPWYVAYGVAGKDPIPPYENERIDTAKERIRRYFAESAIKEADPNRFEQELIYYLEKLDITEEKIRLAKHIDYFRSTMDTEESSGKKLGFIAQEMGREINTIGSKANHVEIQKLVVQMKDELEKIKEQLGNIL